MVDAIRPTEIVDFNQSAVETTIKAFNQSFQTPALVQKSKREAADENFNGYKMMAPPCLKNETEAHRVREAFINAGWKHVRYSEVSLALCSYIFYFSNVALGQTKPLDREVVLLRTGAQHQKSAL